MKKSIILLALALISANAFAQSEQAEKKFHFGIKAGFNVSNLSPVKWEHLGEKGTTKSKIIPGFHASVTFNYAFNDWLGIQPELVYSAQGGKNPFTGIQHYHYVHIPLLIDIKPIKKLPFSILAGGLWGVCVAAKSGEDDKWFFGIDNGFDAAVVLGVQYIFIKHLTVGLRYNLGVLPTETSEALVATLEDGNVVEYMSKHKGARNNVAQLSVGWTF